jgi:hypothetical protein
VTAWYVVPCCFVAAFPFDKLLGKQTTESSIAACRHTHMQLLSQGHKHSHGHSVHNDVLMGLRFHAAAPHWRW